MDTNLTEFKKKKEKKKENYFLEAATCKKKDEEKEIKQISHFQQFLLFLKINFTSAWFSRGVNATS